MKIGSGSVLVLEKAMTSQTHQKQSVFNLIKGGILAIIRDKAPYEKYRVKTKMAAMGIRGTTFYVSYRKNVYVSGVQHGRVVIDFHDQSRVLGEGNGMIHSLVDTVEIDAQKMVNWQDIDSISSDLIMSKELRYKVVFYKIKSFLKINLKKIPLKIKKINLSVQASEYKLEVLRTRFKKLEKNIYMDIDCLQRKYQCTLNTRNLLDEEGIKFSPNHSERDQIIVMKFLNRTLRDKKIKFKAQEEELEREVLNLKLQHRDMNKKLHTFVQVNNACQSISSLKQCLLSIKPVRTYFQDIL
jgi:hypothetical protein